MNISWNGLGVLENKPRLQKTWIWFVVISVVALSCIMIMRTVWQTDLAWMVATGREILDNGILYQNPFTIDEIGIVVQQWLFDVIVALFGQLGNIGYYIFGFIQIGVLFIAAYFYLSQYKISNVWKFLTICGLYCLLRGCLTSIRPEAITIALLLFTCFALEKFKITGKISFLIILPITVFLESNLHSSMLVFHFAIMAAYMIPSIVKKAYKTYGLLKNKWKILITFITISFIVMFINPYGKDAVMYLFNSFLSGTFSYISVIEMQSLFNIVYGYGVVALDIIIVLIIFLFLKKQIMNYQLYATIGLCFLAILEKRNCMFLYLVVLLLVPYFLKQCSNGDIKININEIKIMIMIISLIAMIFCCFYDIINMNGIVSVIKRDEDVNIANGQDLFPNFLDVHSYIREQNFDIEDVSIFTAFDFGGLFEYFGYKNIYIDARPELYMKRINKTKDILPTFSKIYFDDVDEKEINSFLSEYDFDYLVVQDYAALYDNLQNYQTNYEYVMTVDDYDLYEKIN